MIARKRATSGFTLIELLVVVAVIGILIGILVPSILAGLKTAKFARALTQMKDFDGAIKRYYAEYGRMPVPMGDIQARQDKHYTGAEQAAIVEVLLGLNTNLNRKGIVFLDLEPGMFGVKDLVTMHEMLGAGEPYPDPWGTPYGVLLDLTFDDRIQTSDFPEIRNTVGIYSGGPTTNLSEPPLKTW